MQLCAGFKELPDIFDNPSAIPGHVGKLSLCFMQLENQLLFIDNSHHAPKENTVKEHCAVCP